MAEGILDFDAVVVERVTIRKTVPGMVVPRQWDLRDDIPPEIMLRTFRLMAHSQDAAKAVGRIRDEANQEDETAIVEATAEIERILRAQEDEALTIALAIFQHSYPETTPEDLRAWFTRKEREEIVKLFFFRQFSASSPLSNSTTPEPSQETMETMVAETAETGANPNRATRRHSRHSGGAIPSQKRIKRELGGM